MTGVGVYAPSGATTDLDAPGREDLERRSLRRCGERVGVGADEEWPRESVRDPVVTNRGGDRDDVVLVEAAAQGRIRGDPTCRTRPSLRARRRPGAVRSTRAPGRRDRRGPTLEQACRRAGAPCAYTTPASPRAHNASGPARVGDGAQFGGVACAHAPSALRARHGRPRLEMLGLSHGNRNPPNIPDLPNTSQRGRRPACFDNVSRLSSDAGPTRPVKTTAPRLQRARPPRS